MNDFDKEYENRYNKYFDNKVEQGNNEKIKPYLAGVKENYNGFVYNAAKLIIDLSGDMQKEEIYFGIFVYLYRNGFFSKDNTFEFGAPNNELNSLLGVSVIQGTGVCRNISSLFKDILNDICSIKKINSKALGCGVHLNNYEIQIPHSEIPSNYKIKLSKSGVGGNSLLPDSILKQDHFDVFYGKSENNQLSFMIFDPTNFIIEEIDITDLNSNRTDNVIDLRWNMIDSLYASDKNKKYMENFNNSANKVFNSIKKANHKSLPKRTMELIMLYSIRQCEKQMDKLVEFYKDNKFRYKCIEDGAEKCFEVDSKIFNER